MELLDRYLQAVKKHLPWARQDDIIAELKANLEAQLEDKEAELGRPLTAAETEAWLKRMGAPFQMAARYFPQRYLIGPAVFSMYWMVLRLAISWALIIYLVVNGLLLVAGNPSASAAVEAMLRIPWVLMWVAAWVTLAFAAIEFGVTHYPSKWRALTGDTFDWSPGAMPAVEKETSFGKKPRSYTGAVAEVVFGFLILFWMLLVPHYPYLLMGPGAAYVQGYFEFEPILVVFYWWVVGLNVLQLAWRSVDLMRGSWQRPGPWPQIAFKAFALIPLGILFTARDHVWVTLKHPAADQMRYGVAVDAINKAIHSGLMVICAIAVLQLLWEIGQIVLNAYRKREAARR